MAVGAWILHVAVLMGLISAARPSPFCRCLLHHPQSFSCHIDFVIKGEFLNVSQTTIPEYPNFSYKGFNIKAKEVYKGKISQDVFFVASLAHSPCEYTHSPDHFYQDYLITVHQGRGLRDVSICCFIKPWSKLSSGQIKGFQGIYAKGCGCEVTACFSQPCPTTEKQCAFIQYDESLRENQERNQICIQNEEGICTWETII